MIFLDETDTMSSPMKAKGVGELGICGVCAAVANAVYNATGVRVRDYPVTLDKLLARLHRRSGRDLHQRREGVAAALQDKACSMAMEDGETLLKPGDCIVQRGTNHAWVNKSDTPCTLMAILIDAERAT